MFKQEPEQQQEQKTISREELIEYRRQLGTAIVAAHRKSERLKKLQGRPSFLKLETDEISRHFRRVKACETDIEKKTQLAEQIDAELSK